MYSYQLSDYPFKQNIDAFLGFATISQYDKAITEIWNAVNWNNITWYNPFTYGADIRRDWVEEIINTYTNYVLKDSNKPIYDAKLAAKGDTSQWNNLIKPIAAATGYDQNLVRNCLDQLYYGTKDGRIEITSILDPRNYAAHADDRALPESADSFKNSIPFKFGEAAKDTLGFVFNYFVPIAFIVGGLYVAKRTGLLDKGFDAIKGKVNKKSSTVSDQDLFGGAYTPGPTYYFYEVKSDGTMGITTNISKIKEKYGARKVKVHKQSKDYEEVKEKQNKYVKTNPMF